MKNNIKLNTFVRMYRTSKKTHLVVPNLLDEIIIGSMLGELSAVNFLILEFNLSNLLKINYISNIFIHYFKNIVVLNH